jgi:hypothetical protein
MTPTVPLDVNFRGCENGKERFGGIEATCECEDRDAWNTVRGGARPSPPGCARNGPENAEAHQRTAAS